MIVFIDTGILGLLANPNKKGEAAEVEQWLLSLLSRGVLVLTSDICDYEVRRNLILESLRKPNINSVASLDEIKNLITFLPISNEVMIEAAGLWAQARIQGIPTADDKSLDADIIICAQYKILEQEYPGRYIVIATTNVKHLSRFTEAKKWQEIEF
ncbi:MAG: type II toxin-antitoxin system VapC family toxin [Xenococcaceae cyanobacterium MO_207.B15]|nr:type II toxin-antitoxin system VapC family toxin [Xenococcaceae cyanobacterium MO_207.B15]